MSGFGEQRHHGTYDDVAAELGAAARRLAAPLAMVARKRALDAQREAASNRETVKAIDVQRHVRQLRDLTDAQRQHPVER